MATGAGTTSAATTASGGAAADGRQSRYLPREALDALVQRLRVKGYTVISPVLVDGAISFRAIRDAAELPRGIRDEQEAGRYRAVPGDPDLTFEYAVGADGPKRYLFPPSQRLSEFHVEGEQFVLDASAPQVPRLAFLGVRPCDLAAMRVQDRVFGADDPSTMRCESEGYYTQTRREALTIAVNCTRPGGTCFCHSMGTGPQATDGYDLALTELRGGFIVDVGSERGAEVARDLPLRAPTSAELELAELKLRAAKEHMGRSLQVAGLAELLARSLEHPAWDDVARRCLSCGNCTMVCPTCFCSTVSDTTGLSGVAGRATRTRRWESCFTHQFSYTTAGPIRHTIRARYRHWLRHKLCTWQSQFGCGGCVGCGRCVTWCPVGIDITAEAARLRAPAAVEGAAAVAGARPPSEVRP